MKDRDEPSTEISPVVDTKEKKTSVSKKLHKKNKSSKMLWVVLVVLVIGLISFIKANNDVFHLSKSSSSSYSYSCGTTSRYSGSDNIQEGVGNRYGSGCVSEVERFGEEVWRFVLSVTPLVMGVSTVVIATSLGVIAWHMSKLVKVLSKRD